MLWLNLGHLPASQALSPSPVERGGHERLWRAAVSPDHGETQGCCPRGQKRARVHLVLRGGGVVTPVSRAERRLQAGHGWAEGLDSRRLCPPPSGHLPPPGRSKGTQEGGDPPTTRH
ncbi:unnamed protein product [Rangifer tarandus platyrhynchus]|uniref:Uncharacterized protein n=1 Tax=Rangifer tarandus platyrhynchus TaxID=3082113 RepID=A0AC60A8N3_RANTA